MDDYSFNKRNGGPMYTLFDVARYLFILAVFLAIAYSLSSDVEGNPLLKVSFFCALLGAAARHWFIQHQMPGDNDG